MSKYDYPEKAIQAIENGNREIDGDGNDVIDVRLSIADYTYISKLLEKEITK